MGRTAEVGHDKLLNLLDSGTPSLDRILLEVGPPEHHHDMADIMDAAALELHTSHAR